MQFKDIAAKLAAIGLPLLGGAVAGPAGAAAMKGVAAALGLGADATPEQAAVALGSLSGEQLVALRTIEADLAKATLASSDASDKNQTALIAGDQAGGFFKSGWRPAAAWACVMTGLCYPVLRVLLPWTLQVAGVQGVPALPSLDTGEAMTTLLGLLGLAGLRHRERLAGKA